MLHWCQDESYALMTFLSSIPVVGAYARKWIKKFQGKSHDHCHAPHLHDAPKQNITIIQNDNFSLDDLKNNPYSIFSESFGDTLGSADMAELEAMHDWATTYGHLNETLLLGNEIEYRRALCK